MTAIIALCALAVCASGAMAAFPGRNGAIALQDSEGSTPGNCPGQPGCSGTAGVSLIAPSGRPLHSLAASCTDVADDCDPSWSPDGTELTYDASESVQPPNPSALPDTRGRIGLVGIGQPTTAFLVLSIRPIGAPAPVFSPDGRQVLFAWAGRLWRERVDGTGLRAIPLPRLRPHLAWPVWPATPAWSSRGMIAFVYRDDIYLVHPNGRGLRRLTYYGGLDPSFSPNGRQVAFVHADVGINDDELGSGPIDIIDVDGQHLRRLPGLGRICPCAGPAWSPDGRRVAFITDTARSNAGLSNSLYTVDTDGTGRRRMDTAGQYSRLGAPDWQPLPRVMARSTVRPAKH